MKERSKNTALRTRLRRAYDRLTLCVCRAELTGGRNILIQGCRDILCYDPTCISLQVEDPDVGVLTVRGTSLVCLSYHADAVVIEGKIREVVLEGQQERNGGETKK